MAAQSWVGRFLRALAAVALRMRQPARRAFGSVPAAVAICAVVVGIYDFVIGFHYLAGSDYYYFFLGFRQMRYIAAYTAFASSLSDVVLVFGVFQREEQILQYVVCAVLALFTFCGLMPFIILILTAYLKQWISVLWEVPRLLLYPLHFFLMVCLLADLREQISDAPTVADGVNNSTSGEGHHLLKDEEKEKGNGVAEAHQHPVSSSLC